jgi:hypothetical protein
LDDIDRRRKALDKEKKDITFDELNREEKMLNSK